MPEEGELPSFWMRVGAGRRRATDRRGRPCRCGDLCRVASFGVRRQRRGLDRPATEVADRGPDTVRVVGPKYVAYVEAPSTAQQVSDATGLDAGALQDAVDASIAPDTGNITITADAVARSGGRSGDRLRAGRRGLLERRPPHDRNDDRRGCSPERPRRAAPTPPRGRCTAGRAHDRDRRLGAPRARTASPAVLAGHGKDDRLPVVGRIPNVQALHSRPTEAFSDPAVGSAARTLRANLEPQLRERTSKSSLSRPRARAMARPPSRRCSPNLWAGSGPGCS